MIVTFLVWSSPAPLPCLSEDLSVVTFQCSVIVRDFALWGVGVGPPTAFRRSGPSVPWVSLPGPTGVMTHPG